MEENSVIKTDDVFQVQKLFPRKETVLEFRSCKEQQNCSSVFRFQFPLTPLAHSPQMGPKTKLRNFYRGLHQ
jgi:hypothetical protein